MRNYKRIPISEEELEELIRQKGYKNDSAEYFKETVLEELVDDEEDLTVEEKKISVFNFAEELTNKYISLRKKGHSVTWSKSMSINLILEDSRPVDHSYSDVWKKSGEKIANNDLDIHCNELDKDDIFLSIYKQGIAGFDLNPEENAEKYSKTYHKLLKDGHSTLFTKAYCDELVLMGNNDTYAEDYAFTYEDMINKGKSEEIARDFAEKRAGELVDVKLRFWGDDGTEQEMIDFAELKAAAYLVGIEYLDTHKVNNSDKFLEILENVYLNFEGIINEESIKEIVQISISRI